MFVVCILTIFFFFFNVNFRNNLLLFWTFQKLDIFLAYHIPQTNKNIGFINRHEAERESRIYQTRQRRE